jgi:hypothetical protein
MEKLVVPSKFLAKFLPVCAYAEWYAEEAHAHEEK